MFLGLLECLHGLPPGFATGFEVLDSVLGGVPHGKITLLTGQPSADRTAYMLNLIRKILQKAPAGRILFGSSQMPPEEFLFRLLSLNNGWNPRQANQHLTRKIIAGLTASVCWFKDLPLWIAPAFGETTERWAKEALDLAEREKIDLVIFELPEETDAPSFLDAMKHLERLTESIGVPVLCSVPLPLSSAAFARAAEYGCGANLHLERAADNDGSADVIQHKLTVITSFWGPGIVIRLESDPNTMRFYETGIEEETPPKSPLEEERELWQEYFEDQENAYFQTMMTDITEGKAPFEKVQSSI